MYPVHLVVFTLWNKTVLHSFVTAFCDPLISPPMSIQKVRFVFVLHFALVSKVARCIFMSFLCLYVDGHNLSFFRQAKANLK